jgi:hypothetical protein
MRIQTPEPSLGCSLTATLANGREVAQTAAAFVPLSGYAQ